MKNKLKDYVTGKTNYIPLLNYLREKRNIYEILGKYAYEEVFKGNLPEELKFFEEYIKPKSIIKKMDLFNKINHGYNSLAIMLLTHSHFVIDKLKELFGEPIYHDEFGEGFDGEYDDETGEYGEPDIKEEFASYFITIEGVDLHIGYDHRGLTVEVKDGTNVSDLLKALKKFISLCYS